MLKALACGLLVITAHNNGAAELFNPPAEDYVIDDPHDPAQLAWAMTQLLDLEQSARSGSDARRIAARWTFDHDYPVCCSRFSLKPAGANARLSEKCGPIREQTWLLD